MTDNVINLNAHQQDQAPPGPYAGLATEARAHADRIALLAVSLREKTLEEQVDALLAELGATVAPLLSSCASALNELDDRLDAVEGTLEEAGVLDGVGGDDGAEDGEESPGGDIEEEEDDDIGESQLEPRHAQLISEVITSFRGYLTATIASGVLDDAQRSVVERQSNQCQNVLDLIQALLLVEDDDEDED